MLLLTVPLSVLDLISTDPGKRDFLGAIYAALQPFWIVFAIVLPCALLIGLPVAFILRRLNAESMTTYTLLGTFIGYAVPFLTLSAGGGGYILGLSALGAFSGAATATAWSWSKARAQSSAGTLNAD